MGKKPGVCLESRAVTLVFLGLILKGLHFDLISKGILSSHYASCHNSKLKLSKHAQER